MRKANHGARFARLVLSFLPVCAALVFAVPSYGFGKKEQGVQAGSSQSAAVQERQSEPGFGMGDGLVFIGVSNRRSNRDEAIQIALEDAARRLSFFDSVWARSVSRDYRGGRALDVSIGSEYVLEYERDLGRYIEELEFDPETDVFENNNAVFVVARKAGGSPMPSARGHSFGNRRPAWVDSPPLEIGGYPAGVGFAVRHADHRDTIIKSYERATVNIIESMAVQISGGQEHFQGTNSVFDFTMSAAGEITASGTLTNFYIIESWTDPANLSVWTLAVARDR